MSSEGWRLKRVVERAPAPPPPSIHFLSTEPPREAKNKGLHTLYLGKYVEKEERRKEGQALKARSSINFLIFFLFCVDILFRR